MEQITFAIIYSAQLLAAPMGLISESVPLFGNKDKSYIFVMSGVQLFAALLIAVGQTRVYMSQASLCAINFLMYFGMTWVDTVIGGLIVKEAKKDPNNDKGAEDMRYFEWFSWAVGGIIPVMLGPLLLYQLDHTNITKEYYVMALNAALMMLLCVFLPSNETVQADLVKKNESNAQANTSKY